jgi:hypothetical protein
MKQILANPLMVNLEIDLIVDILNILNKCVHGYPFEIIKQIEKRILEAKSNAESNNTPSN